MSQTMEIKVPDIGDYKAIPVIEIHVRPGDVVQAEQALVTLESDKATMDVPSSTAGIVRDIKLKIGDEVSEGSVILTLEPNTADAVAPKAAAPAASNQANAAEQTAAAPAKETSAPVASEPAKVAPAVATAAAPATVNASASEATPTGTISHASPSVRKFARELGVDISKVPGTGPKNRITQSDVQAFVKNALSQGIASSGAAGGELNLLPWPKIDFSKFGAIEAKPLSRIKKLSAANLARNWVMIPAVTYHEEADISELEAFRVQLNKENEKLGIKLTMLAFLIKASAFALKKFPEFNSSLDGEQLILKNYFHIGFAADTPNGLLVPVIRDVDKKGVLEIAAETSELAQLARSGKLKPEQMQGACFTISSVGGLGGTGFAPIINAPEVAILGVSRSTHKPVWDGQQFVPRLIMPLSMTADHRVIDGAMATRFTAFIAQLLSDFRRVML